MTIAEQITRAKTDYDEVYEAGKKSEYDAFWDEFQQNGNLTDYGNAFAGYGWTKECFKPKYNMSPIHAGYMFANCGRMGGVDLAQILEDLGITLDTSNCVSFGYFVMYNAPSRIPTIDTRSADSLDYFDCNASVQVFDKIILRDDGSQNLANMFYIASSLTEVRIEGVIGSTFNIHWSTGLSHDSLISIINALKDYSASGTMRTLNIGGTNRAKLTDDELAIAERKGWEVA